jgi:M6 family metalloprotease-like protein
MVAPPWWWRVLVATLVFAAPAGLQAQAVTASGTLTAVWGDPPALTDIPPELHWFLADDQGRIIAVDIPPPMLRRLGGVEALDRRRVAVRGLPTRRPGARPTDPLILEAQRVRPLAPAPDAAQPSLAYVGNHPYALLLCRFSDQPTEPRPPEFFESLLGDDYPNMGHYFREVSAGRMDLSGSRVFGWFTLPHPRADYLDAGTGIMSLPRLASDCLAAAGPVVELPRFAGVIAQFNGSFSTEGMGSAYGGSLALSVDGATRVWPFVWMPDWAMESSRYGIFAHEIGHSLGLPHSSGPYDRTYDSNWDVMSNPYLRYDSGVQGWVPGQTIAFHKDRLGWIPRERKVVVAQAGRTTLRIEPHSIHSGGDSSLYLEIRIPGTPDAYTMEARARTGYDAALPGATLLIHRVPDPLGPDCSPHRCARVVDANGNGNPNDQGAMWSPGEVFEDGQGVRVAVLGGSEAGWDVEVTVVLPARPAGLTLDRAAGALHGRAVLTDDEVAYLDRLGNRNGRFDLGDFLAFVRREEP